MRHAFPTLSIALLSVAFATGTHSVFAQNTQTAPTQTQPQPRSPGGDVKSPISRRSSIDPGKSHLLELLGASADL